jgi:hypothetical protein
MPNNDLATLMTFNIALTLVGILLCFVCAWAIIRHSINATRELSQTIGDGMRGLAEIQREVAFMIRRQYGDIDRDLQEIKEMLGGQ